MFRDKWSISTTDCETDLRSASERQWKQRHSHDNKETGAADSVLTNLVTTMFYARSVVLYALVCICSTNDSKIKNASKPVRLFTEEELQRYDGSEVCAVSPKHCASLISTFRNYVLID